MIGYIWALKEDEEYYLKNKEEINKESICFCQTIADIFEVVELNAKFVLIEIEALGQANQRGLKYETNRYRIIRTIPESEYLNKRLKDSYGNIVEFNNQFLNVYNESSEGFWSKFEYNSDGLETYCENWDGYWRKTEYNEKGQETYWEDSEGFWFRFQYDESGKKVRKDCSDGSHTVWEYNDTGEVISFKECNAEGKVVYCRI